MGARSGKQGGRRGVGQGRGGRQTRINDKSSPRLLFGRPPTICSIMFTCYVTHTLGRFQKPFHRFAGALSAWQSCCYSMHQCRTKSQVAVTSYLPRFVQKTTQVSIFFLCNTQGDVEDLYKQEVVHFSYQMLTDFNFSMFKTCFF